MGSEWSWRTLGELTENFDSIRVPVKEPDRRPGPYPYYGASGVVDHVDRYLYDGECLLVAEDGENLRTRTTPVAFLARGRFWVNNHAHVIRGNGQADTRYLMYALAAADIGGYLSGSAMPKLTQASLNRIPLFVPEIAEQRRIAGILGALDDKIELNRRMSQTLESMARALFKSWFVDFDPVRARSEGRDPGLSPLAVDLFPSHIGGLDSAGFPDSWRRTSLSDLVEASRDTVDPAKSPTTTFAHYSIPAFDAGWQPAYQAGARIRSLKFRVPPGCVLLSKLNPELPRVWLVNGDVDEHSVASTEFLVLRPRAAVTSTFLYCLAVSPEFRTDLEALVTGTSRSHQRAQPEAVLAMQISLPPAPLLAEFDRRAAPMLGRMLASLAAMATLTRLRDSLVPVLARAGSPPAVVGRAT